VFESREYVFWVLVAAFTALLAAAANEEEDWIALVLGAALIPVATELTCYYYVVFAVFGLLWKRFGASGIWLCGLAAASNIVPAFLASDDDVYTVLSVLTLVYVSALTFHVLSAKRDHPSLFRLTTEGEISDAKI
jgi:hypothetical protein